jgi:hypothetical protein
VSRPTSGAKPSISKQSKMYQIIINSPVWSNLLVNKTSIVVIFGTAIIKVFYCKLKKKC